jgi:hypothetical protein
MSVMDASVGSIGVGKGDVACDRSADVVGRAGKSEVDNGRGEEAMGDVVVETARHECWKDKEAKEREAKESAPVLQLRTPDAKRGMGEGVMSWKS